ncbi:uncharacterized protein LOC135309936 [Plodia interpunctella]|uniref:uncharacterized protein LOC135309936 n=1 Tax=Plodia interpunctella TaxID=58824 RepID=UPI00310158A2
MRRWEADLARATYGVRTVEALRQVLERWMLRRRKPLTFRMTQVLTGHGCFGEYLHRVAQRETEPVCHDCGEARDTAQHVLEQCPRWSRQRHDLVAVLGGVDLSLPSVVNAMLGSDGAWAAVASFCETVMSQREAEERNREDHPLAEPIRRRRTGVRRRRYLARLQAPP